MSSKFLVKFGENIKQYMMGSDFNTMPQRLVALSLRLAQNRRGL